MKKIFQTRFIYPLITAMILCTIALGSQVSLAEREADPAIRMSTDEKLTVLIQLIERLSEEVQNLKKSNLLLNDTLDEIVKLAKSGSTGVKQSRTFTKTQTQTASITITAEQKAGYDAKINSMWDEFSDERKVYGKLVRSKGGSGMVKDMRNQVVEWLTTPAADRIYETPCSEKQFAWLAFLMYKKDYPYPYTIKELYPNGKEKK